MHYPLMAWTREGGDKGHKTGVHFDDGGWTDAIKACLPEVKQQLVAQIEGATLFTKPLDLSAVKAEYEHAILAINRIHELNINDAAERAKQYRDFRNSANFQSIKDAFDMWCALWFWPGDKIELAPMPDNFSLMKLSPDTLSLIRKIASENRFFHWELEFPDVFSGQNCGFNAVLGNPPWDIAKPKSQEFFSSVDPLYRSYGKQQAISAQNELFKDIDIELSWLNYCASFKALSNWVKGCGNPFGSGSDGQSLGKPKQNLHELWRLKRNSIYSEKQHGLFYQGGGDVNLYKLFLEHAYWLVENNGRIGFIVPSGVYSDNGTRDLRQLFLKQCSWEWIFGFENREKIFDIHPSFKFNPLIIQKGGATIAIHAAFMRRNIADWETAESFAVSYPLEQIRRFSPESLAILEIQSDRDLEVLTKIYANSILLGDKSENGWGIKLGTEFHMTSDSHLFPPRSVWEDWGYRPDEYSRWVKGPWKTIEELYTLPEVYAHIEDQPICAQPPYDSLKVRRCNIPAGIILSRNAQEWLRDSEIPVVTFTEANGKPITKKVKDENGDIEIINIEGPAIAQPLYQGVMIWQWDSAYSDYITGSNRTASWEHRNDFYNNLPIPQFLIAKAIVTTYCVNSYAKVGFRAIQNATNQRTMISTLLPSTGTGNSMGIIASAKIENGLLIAALCSFPFDYVLRPRMSQANLNSFVIEETGIPRAIHDSIWKNYITNWAEKLLYVYNIFSPLKLSNSHIISVAMTTAERLRVKILVDVAISSLFNLSIKHFLEILKDCDHPIEMITNKKFARELYVKGFWRVDKEKEPELRQTVLTLVAFHDLEKKISECGGDTEAGIKAFCEQNNGEGWMLPDKLRLADYSLGHDDRANEYQPVSSRFGPRFYDWQLAQSAEESWKECHIHARNLIGSSSYERLLNREEEVVSPPAEKKTTANTQQKAEQPELF
jgi:hypothetical protein